MKRITYPLFALFLCMQISAQNPIFNITSQAQWNPETVPQYSDIWAYVDCSDNEYALIGSRYDIHFVDVTDPTAPAEVTSFAGGEASIWRDIKTYRGHAYAVSDNTEEGLMIFDMSGLPADVVKTYHSNAFFNSAQNIFIDETYGRMYVVGTDVNDLLIFDLTENPDDPTLLASTELPGAYTRDIFVQNSIAYCSHLANGLFIYDCSDPTDIITLGSVTNYADDVMNSSSWLSSDGTQLVFCDETPGAPVKLLDVSDPANLEVQEDYFFSSALVATDPNSIANKPYIRDNFAFVSYFHDGVQVFDISNPDNIVKVAYLDTYPDNTNYDGLLGNWGLYPYLPSGNILASDIENGLFILSMDLIELSPLGNNNLVDPELQMLAAPILCEGDSVTLTAIEGDYTYLWSMDGQVLDIETNQVVAKETGSYQLQISNGTCTSISEMYDIDFLLRPDLSSMTGDVVELCPGESYQIMAPTGMEDYIWLKDGNVLPNTNSLLFAVQSGIYSLITYNSNGCASISPSYTIEVIDIPIPNLATSESTICNNETALLQAAEGADAYTWYYNGMQIVMGEDSFIEVDQAGNYTVELQIGDCTKLSDEVEISVIQAPNNTIGINGPTSFCPGDTVMLSAAQTIDIVGWSWQLDGLEIGMEPSIEVGEAGQYELMVTGSNSCEASNTIELDIYDVAVPTVLVTDNNMESSFANAYQWFLFGVPIDGASQQNYEAATNGIYYVQITDTNGCQAISEPFGFTITGTIVSDEFSELKVFPNPTTNILTISLELEVPSDFQIELTTSNGQLLSQQMIENAASFSKTIDMVNYPAGIYFIHLTNDTGSISRRFVKL